MVERVGGAGSIGCSSVLGARFKSLEERQSQLLITARLPRHPFSCLNA